MMIDERHKILSQLIEGWEDVKNITDLQNLFVMAVSLASECIGYIDAIKENTNTKDRLTGRWIYIGIGGFPQENKYSCSNCHTGGLTTWHYCPNCGADMREDED